MSPPTLHMKTSSKRTFGSSNNARKKSHFRQNTQHEERKTSSTDFCRLSSRGASTTKKETTAIDNTFSSSNPLDEDNTSGTVVTVVNELKSCKTENQLEMTLKKYFGLYHEPYKYRLGKCGSAAVSVTLPGSLPYFNEEGCDILVLCLLELLRKFGFKRQSKHKKNNLVDEKMPTLYIALILWSLRPRVYPLDKYVQVLEWTSSHSSSSIHYVTMYYLTEFVVEAMKDDDKLSRRAEKVKNKIASLDGHVCSYGTNGLYHKDRKVDTVTSLEMSDSTLSFVSGTKRSGKNFILVHLAPLCIKLNSDMRSLAMLNEDGADIVLFAKKSSYGKLAKKLQVNPFTKFASSQSQPQSQADSSSDNNSMVSARSEDNESIMTTALPVEVNTAHLWNQLEYTQHTHATGEEHHRKKKKIIVQSVHHDSSTKQPDQLMQRNEHYAQSSVAEGLDNDESKYEVDHNDDFNDDCSSINPIEKFSRRDADELIHENLTGSSNLHSHDSSIDDDIRLKETSQHENTYAGDDRSNRLKKVVVKQVTPPLRMKSDVLKTIDDKIIVDNCSSSNQNSRQDDRSTCFTSLKSSIVIHFLTGSVRNSNDIHINPILNLISSTNEARNNLLQIEKTLEFFGFSEKAINLKPLNLLESVRKCAHDTRAAIDNLQAGLVESEEKICALLLEKGNN